MGSATGDGEYKAGDSFTITATAKSGYVIKELKQHDNEAGTTLTTTREEMVQFGALNSSYTRFNLAFDVTEDHYGNWTYEFVFEADSSGGSSEGIICKISSSGASSSDYIQLYECYLNSSGIYEHDYTRPLGTQTLLTASSGYAVGWYAKPGSGRKIEYIEVIYGGESLGKQDPEEYLDPSGEFTNAQMGYSTTYGNITYEIIFYFAQA